MIGGRSLVAALVACMIAAPARAAPEHGSLSVQGTGVVEVVPDTVEISVGVSSRGATPTEAVDANSAVMERVLADTARAGIDRRDVRTSVLRLTNVEENRLRKFQAFNVARVQVRDVARLGAVLRELVSSGANEIHGIRFYAADPKPYLEQARRQAVEDARRRAEVLAEAAGRRLGPIIEITDVTYGDPGVVAEARAMQRSNVPVEPGELALRAGVQIKWRLEP